MTGRPTPSRPSRGSPVATCSSSGPRRASRATGGRSSTSSQCCGPRSGASFRDPQHPLASRSTCAPRPWSRPRLLTPDPIELLDLVEATIVHRLQNIEQGLSEANYASSLLIVAGQRLTARLLRLPADAQQAAQGGLAHGGGRSNHRSPRPDRRGGAGRRSASARVSGGDLALGPLARAIKVSVTPRPDEPGERRDEPLTVFHSVNPFPIERIIGRQHEVARVIALVFEHGQSVAIVGEPGTWKDFAPQPSRHPRHPARARRRPSSRPVLPRRAHVQHRCRCGRLLGRGPRSPPDHGRF